MAERLEELVSKYHTSITVDEQVRKVFFLQYSLELSLASATIK